MLAGIVASMLTSIHIIERISVENSKQTTHIVSARVHDSILNEMLRPITVAQTMAKDESLVKLMERAEEENTKEVEEEIASYLNAIYTGFGYQMVFAVCDKTNAYYTYNGMTKTLDPENNEEDIWYKIFCDSQKEYDLDVDWDTVNNWDLSVFVNVQITDEQGKFLGICGVAVEMNKLQQMFKQYEEDYHIKINLINHKRLVQVDSELEKIENSYVEAGNVTCQEPDKYIFERKEDTSIVSVYMADLDWFLVIQDKDSHSVDVGEIVWPSVLILGVALLAMGIAAYLVVSHEKKMQGELSEKVEIEKKQVDILKSMSGIYSSCYLVNLKENRSELISSHEFIRSSIQEKENAQLQLVQAINHTVDEAYKEAAHEFTDLSTLAERLNDAKIVSEQFLGTQYGWFRAQFIANSYDKNHNLETVIFTTQVTDKEKRKVEKLVKITMTDEMTGLYNRRAYEKKVDELSSSLADDVVVILMDLNGLKTANDNLGHEAGDELICGAAKCMMTTFGSRGQVFRTGGDEFIAIVQVELAEMESLLEQFDKEVSQWKGERNSSMSIAVGAVSHEEYPDLDIRELVRMADKCMYYDKSEYYERIGKKRRK